MCVCGTPTRETDEHRAPLLGERDVLIYDEPGRCSPQVNGTGNTDYHSHHFRLVQRHSFYTLLVRHGAGDEAINVGGRYTRVAELFAMLPDSDARYLMLYAIYRVHSEAARASRDVERAYWQKAARENRIHTRKMPRRDDVKVWVEVPR